MGILSKVANAVRMIASATVGVSLALAGSVILGAAALTFKAMDLCWSEVYKKMFSVDVYHSPVLQSLSDSSFNALKGLWTGFGLYTFIKVAEGVNDHTGKVSAEAALKQNDQHHSASNVGIDEIRDNKDPSKAEEMAKKSAAKIQIREENTAILKGPKGSALDNRVNARGA